MNSAEVTVLVRRAAAGQQTAWEVLVHEYSPLVWSVVRGFRLGETQAADAAQTTWLRLVEHLTDIRDPERLPGWLQTTARRGGLPDLPRRGGGAPAPGGRDPRPPPRR